MKALLSILIVIFLAIFVTSLLNNNECNHKSIEIIKKDTIEIHDTIYFEKPMYDTIYLERVVRDTLYTTDSIKVEVNVPISTLIYSDSLYNLQISGFKANLDHITVYPKTTIITQEKVREIERKQPYFEFKPSIGLGYGMINKNIDLFVGGSLVFNLK